MSNRLAEQPDIATATARASRTAQAPTLHRERAATFHPQAWVDEASKFIGRHPAVCLGVAVAGGLLLGALIKRRK